MASIMLAEADEDIDSILASLTAASAAVEAEVHSAIHRCMRVTGGTALPALAALLDPLLTGLVARMHVCHPARSPIPLGF